MSLPESIDSPRPLSRETLIRARSGWQLIDWRELLEYRDLFRFLVARDVKVLYKQSVLGFGWAIFAPLFSMLVFTVIFGRLAKVPSDGAPYALFSYVALVPWTYFSGSLLASTTSLISNAGVITKVYFPRLLVPLTPVVAKLVDFSIALSVLFLLMAWYGAAPTAKIWMLPVLVVLMAATAAGVGMWLSALAVQYRDIRFAMSFFNQILMYSAPVVWPSSLVPEPWRTWCGVYPMFGVIEGFRAALLGTVAFPWRMIGLSALSAALVLLSGAFYFRRVEKVFADVA